MYNSKVLFVKQLLPSLFFAFLPSLCLPCLLASFLSSFFPPLINLTSSYLITFSYQRPHTQEKKETEVSTVKVIRLVRYSCRMAN